MLLRGNNGNFGSVWGSAVFGEYKRPATRVSAPVHLRAVLQTKIEIIIQSIGRSVSLMVEICWRQQISTKANTFSGLQWIARARSMCFRGDKKLTRASSTYRITELHG